MRLGLRLGLLAQRLRLGDHAVIVAWMLGKAIEVRWHRWRMRHTVVIASRDHGRLFWTVQAPEKIKL